MFVGINIIKTSLLVSYSVKLNQNDYKYWDGNAVYHTQLLLGIWKQVLKKVLNQHKQCNVLNATKSQYQSSSRCSIIYWQGGWCKIAIFFNLQYWFHKPTKIFGEASMTSCDYEWWDDLTGWGAGISSHLSTGNLVEHQVLCLTYTVSLEEVINQCNVRWQINSFPDIYQSQYISSIWSAPLAEHLCPPFQALL